MEQKQGFEEEHDSYSQEQAVEEAGRCLQCTKPPCVDDCPAGVDIPGFLGLVKKKKFQQAAEKIWERQIMPGICGRVCYRELQCRKNCLRGNVDEKIFIGRVESFVGDEEKWEMERQRKKGKKAAVVGAGPGGIACAIGLSGKGFEVRVFDSCAKAGGILHTGIPDFRLPEKVVGKELAKLDAMGIGFEGEKVLGENLSLEELKKGYDAVFLALGAHAPRRLGVEGEELKGVIAALDFLRHFNLGEEEKLEKKGVRIEKGKKVVVIGAGDVAMDAARVCRRLGAEVVVSYRGAKENMKACKAELEGAERDGVEFVFMVSPKKFAGNDGKLSAVGFEESSGERVSRKEVAVDVAIVAIGQVVGKIPEEVEVDGLGRVKVDEKGMTSMEGVFAGGDCVLGPATVVEAIAAGRDAAERIEEFLKARA